MNIDIRVFTKILADQIQRYIERINYHNPWGLAQEYKVGLTFRKQWYHNKGEKQYTHLDQCRKAQDEIKYLSLVKALDKVETEENFLNLMKNI